MSLWEKESLAAEAFLPAKRKTKKPSKQIAVLRQKGPQV
jgi:hypothetical protein